MSELTKKEIKAAISDVMRDTGVTKDGMKAAVSEALNDYDCSRLLNEQAAMKYTGMGRSFLRSWAEEIGAVVVFSSRLRRYDKRVIDPNIDAVRDEHRKGRCNVQNSKAE